MLLPLVGRNLAYDLVGPENGHKKTGLIWKSAQISFLT